MAKEQVVDAVHDGREPVTEWLTLREVGELLKISRRTAARMVSREAGRDRLPAARFGNTVRIRRVTLNKFLERHTA